jgi:flagellar basal-body rod protein FlgB
MKLVTDAVHELEAAMRFRTARQGVLAGNVANADTPRYRARDLVFESVLDQERLPMVGTHARHLSAGSAQQRPYELVVGPKGDGPDRNGVSLDDELIRMSRNAGAYQDQADILSRLLGLMRSAIAGEG